MAANRRSVLQIPFPGVMSLKRFVGKNAGGADLDQIPAEFAFKNAILLAAEIDMIMRGENIEVAAARVVPVKTDATVTGDAAIHLMSHEWTEVLAPERPLLETESPIAVTGHDRHVLQMAFTAFVANRAIMRMIDHEPFDDGGPEGFRFRIEDRDPRAIGGGSHARHDDLSAGIFLVFELLDGALPARPHRAQGGMPAEIGKIHSQRKTRFEQVFSFRNLILSPVDLDLRALRHVNVPLCDKRSKRGTDSLGRANDPRNPV